MKNKFLVFGLVFTLLVTFVVITGLSSNNEGGKAFTKYSSKSSAVIKCQENQEKKDEVTVYITKTGKKYHKGDCRYLKKSKIKISLKDACKREYTPCKVCKPPKCPQNK